MNLIAPTTLLLSAATVATLSTSAMAQPAQAVAPAGVTTASEPPPTSEGHLSQINGVPIQVGDHHKYYYDFKRWNVSANPVGWMLGSYGASVGYALNSNFTLRADANFYAPAGSDATGFEVGLGAPIYFRRAYEGVFLEPGMIFRRIEEDFDGTSITSTEAGPQMLVGWHWSWDSGLNVALAAGAGRNLTEDGEVFGNGYLRFGYEF